MDHHGKLLFSGVFSSVVREIVVQQGLQQGRHGKLLCSGVIMGSCCAVGSSWEVVVQWVIMVNCSSAGVSGKLLFSGLQQCHQGNCCSVVLSLKLLFSRVSDIFVQWGRQVNCYSGWSSVGLSVNCCLGGIHQGRQEL